MSERDLLKDFMVETFEDAFSELDKQFGALNRVSLRGHQWHKQFGLFMMFGILFPWPDKAEQLSINFETVAIEFPELHESRKKYIEINKKAV